MSFYTIPLKAGVPFKQNTAGTLLLIDSLGAAPGVSVQLTKVGGSDGATMPNRQSAFRLVEPFEGVTFTSAVDTVLGVFLSTSDVQLGFVSGGAVSVPGGVLIANTPAARVPVDVGGAQINVTATNVGISNNLKTLTHQAPAVVGTVAAQVISDANMKRIRFRNADAAAVIALGGAQVSMANAVVVLNPGDVWNEDDAPGAAWFAISDTAGAKLAIMGVAL